MKVTLRNLYMVGQSQALTAIISEQRCNVGEKTGYWAGKMARKVLSELKVIEAERVKVIAEAIAQNPEQMAQGAEKTAEALKVGTAMTPEQNAAADAQFSAFLDMEVDFDFLPLARTELKGARIVNESQLMVLEDAGLLIDEPAATV